MNKYNKFFLILLLTIQVTILAEGQHDLATAVAQENIIQVNQVNESSGLAPLKRTEKSYDLQNLPELIDNKELSIKNNLKPIIKDTSLGTLNKIKNWWANKIPNKTVKIDINGLSGTVPYKLYLLMQELNIDNYRSTANALTPSGIILCGPPGNGKSTLARKLAEYTNSEIMEEKGSTIVKKYMGMGAETIDDIFNKALEKILETGKRVIIFFDEADAFASNNNNSEMTREHEAAVQTLWLNIDKYKPNKKIFIVIATNKFKNLHPTLVDRFSDDVIEILNPDNDMRKETIEFYTDKFDVKVNDQTTNKLITKTDDLSIRAIEDIIKSAKRKANIENNGIVLPEMIDETVTVNKQKPKYNDQPNQLTKDQSSIIRWQKASIAVSMMVTVLPFLYKAKKLIIPQ